MFGGNQPQGFTIIEILIFLAISAILFLSVIGLIDGKQHQTYFFQGAHEFFSQLQDASNNVQTGYYNDNAGYSCTLTSSGPAPATIGAPVISTGGSQGTGFGCTFIGEVIQFAPVVGGVTQYNEYTVYPVFGRQYEPDPPATAPNSPVTSLTDAMPTAPSTVTPSQTLQLPPGLVVSKISYANGGPQIQDSLVGFFSNFAQTSDGVGSYLDSGSLSSSLIPVPIGGGTYITQTMAGSGATHFISSMQNTSGSAVTSSDPSASPTVIDPSGGVTVCLQSTELNNTYAIYTIGGNSTGSGSGNPLSIQLNGVASSCP